MKSWMAILFSALVASASVPQRADACGVKLTIKGSGHRKGIARTSNPSDVLLLGSPPRRLSRDLSSAGHRVEVAPSPGAAKRKSYAIVIAENQQADEARQTFPGSVILVRSGDVVADMRTVEKQVARKPVGGSNQRDPVAVREERPVVAAGPIQPKREIVTAAEPKEVEVAPKVEPKPVEPKPVEPKQTPVVAKTEKVAPPEVAAAEPTPSKPAVTPKTVSRSGSEVYFGLNQDEAKNSSLKKVVAWLNGSPDVQVVVEGHADPSGNADSNMALSQRRAEWVRDALVAAGIDSSRIEVKSFGSTTLKYGTRDGRNRRVVVVAK
jgi:outer membrane protein OmpA-like peptidoglycan-associated protein